MARKFSRRKNPIKNRTNASAPTLGATEISDEVNNTLQSAVELHQAGRIDEAQSLYQTVLKKRPNQADALYLSGTASFQLGNFEKARDMLVAAIRLRPELAEAHSNLGIVLRELGDFESALASCEEALRLKPDYAEALNNMGLALRELGRFTEAETAYRRALELAPNSAESWTNLGNVLKVLGENYAALEAYKKSVASDPTYLIGRRNLANMWFYIPGLTLVERFEHQENFAHAFGPSPSPKPFPNTPDPDRRLKIGFVSSDFREHVVGWNLIPFFQACDRDKFEIYAYAEMREMDKTSAGFLDLCDHWTKIYGLTDESINEKIRADNIDILVFVAGHFDQNRLALCAHRSAPVQASYLDGATSGFGEMDYWLTDIVLHPTETVEKFTEELYRLPVLYQYPPIKNAPPLTAPPAQRNGYITFASFNNVAKINDEVINLWADVLKAVPDSRLILKYRNVFGDATLRDKWHGQFESLEIDKERVNLLSSLDKRSDHLSLYDQADIALDTFPFTGATTTFEALWMGVPVITLMGDTFLSRAAGSLVTHIGHPDWAVPHRSDYVATAKNLATNVSALADLRLNLRDKVTSSLLCDSTAYARSIEAAFHNMWKQWCRLQNVKTNNLCPK